MASMAATLPRPVRRLFAYLRIDFAPAHRQPAWSSVTVATVVALVGSLLADWVVVRVATTVLPSTRGYVHFRFPDYARLTVIGVVIGCAAWPITTRISSQPRWLFARLAVVVTLVLFLPDAYIYWLGQPANAVGVLLVMHVAIAVVTYQSLVRLAPVRSEVAPVGDAETTILAQNDAPDP